MTEEENRAMTADEAAEAEKCPLMQAKRARQKQDRDDVRSGRRTQASMLIFDPDDIRKNWVIKRRSWDF